MRHVDASEARRSFSRLCREVAYGGDRVVIDHHGRGLVALVPLSDAEQLGAPARPVKLASLLQAARSVRRDLEALGIRHLAIFGSFARGTERDESDVDVLLDVDPQANFDLFDLAGVRDRLVELFAREVDVLTSGALKSRDDGILRDAVYAF